MMLNFSTQVAQKAFQTPTAIRTKRTHCAKAERESRQKHKSKKQKKPSAVIKHEKTRENKCVHRVKQTSAEGKKHNGKVGTSGTSRESKELWWLVLAEQEQGAYKERGSKTMQIFQQGVKRLKRLLFLVLCRYFCSILIPKQKQWKKQG